MWFIFVVINRNSGNLCSSTVQGAAPLAQDEPLAEMHVHALCRYSLLTFSDFVKLTDYQQKNVSMVLICIGMLGEDMTHIDLELLLSPLTTKKNQQWNSPGAHGRDERLFCCL